MIILSEVAKKIEGILNDVDEEVNDVNPTAGAYYFHVETEGLHIDHIVKKDLSKNYIPVFISTMGGQYNPVKGLKQSTVSIPITFYFPVRFKKDFYALGDFLAQVFAGATLTYGEISGKGVSNISVPTYGEIQNADFAHFANWLGEHAFEMPKDGMEPYLSMTLVLYITNAAHGFVFGNDVALTLKFTNSDHEEIILNDVDWDGGSLQSNCQATPEQPENALVPETQSWPFNTTYGSSFKIYPNFERPSNLSKYVSESGVYDPNAIYYRKNGNDYIYVGHLTESQYEGYHSGGVALYIKEAIYFFREFMKAWLDGGAQDMLATITITIGDPSWGLTYTKDCFIQSLVLPMEKGQVLCFTASFAKRIEE